ncbi:MAG TPA: hypothetical protein VI278_18435 [Nitrososphaeraceae archaeon]
MLFIEKSSEPSAGIHIDNNGNDNGKSTVDVTIAAITITAEGIYNSLLAVWFIIIIR